MLQIGNWVFCPHCHSDNIIKCGKSSTGKQLNQCEPKNEKTWKSKQTGTLLLRAVTIRLSNSCYEKEPIAATFRTLVMPDSVIPKKHSPFCAGWLENNDPKTVILFYKVKSEEWRAKTNKHIRQYIPQTYFLWIYRQKNDEYTEEIKNIDQEKLKFSTPKKEFP